MQGSATQNGKRPQQVQEQQRGGWGLGSDTVWGQGWEGTTENVHSKSRSNKGEAEG